MNLTPEQWLEAALNVGPFEDWYGGIYARPQSIAPRETYHGGTHDYDHISILGEGVYLLRTKKPNGDVRERSYRVLRHELGIVNIKAEDEHDIVNLTDKPIHFLCMSLQSDNTGEIREQVFHEELTPHG